MQIEDYQRLCQQIIESAQDPVIFVDREGVVRLWNAGAEAVFGYSAQEMVGRSMDAIVPERLRERHWEGFHRVMDTGETRYAGNVLAVPGVRKDGSRVSLEFTVTIVEGDDGKPAGIAAIMRDVTERWQRERAMKERLTELEARVGQ